VAAIDWRARLGERIGVAEPLARHTSARIGGPADFLAVAESAAELADLVRAAWAAGENPLVLGGGTNVLVTDAGVRGLVIVNRARAVVVRDGPGMGEAPTVWAEAGANLGNLARQVGARGLGGLEWAATVPGTVGGAVYGNAGAHGGDMAGNLRLAEILHLDGSVKHLTAGDLAFGYRTSALKRPAPEGAPGPRRPVVLAAELRLSRSTPEAAQAQMERNTAQRKRTQPPGASLGSMFKNPPGDYAGRLIEAAGLKGARVGQAQISPVHANFFVNLGEATAADVLALLALAQDEVQRQFGVALEPEIEIVGSR
jgi:UDP-N-acetylmuramate dehydrogenase